MTEQPSRISYVLGDSAYVQDGTLPVGGETAHVSEQKFAQTFPDFPHDAHRQAVTGGDPVPRFDPYAVQRAFPARWQAYIRANFRSLLHIQQVFGVSETAARKWWNGTGGVNGAYTAIAMREHPAVAHQMLFAAE